MKSGELKMLEIKLEKLMQALAADDEKEALRLLDKYPTVRALHSHDDDDITPLIAGVVKKDHCCSPELFQSLLKEPTDVNASNKRGRRAVHFLASYNRHEFLNTLLTDPNHTVDVNVVCEPDNFSPVYMAALKGCHQSLAQLILLKIDEVNVNLANSLGQTPLQMACFFGQEMGGKQKVKLPREQVLNYLSCIRLLLKAGANVNAQDSKGLTAAHYLAAADIPEDIKLYIFSLLKEYGADFTIQSKLRNKVWEIAKQYKDLNIVKAIATDTIPSLFQYAAIAALKQNPNIVTGSSEEDDLVNRIYKIKLGSRMI